MHIHMGSWKGQIGLGVKTKYLQKSHLLTMIKIFSKFGDYLQFPNMGIYFIFATILTCLMMTRKACLSCNNLGLDP